jgi:hypothetical protein
MEKFDEEDDLYSVIEPIIPVAGLDVDEDASDDDEVEEDLLKDKGGSDDGEDENFETSDNFDDDEE